MLLENINSPADIKGMGTDELKTLAYEIRKFLIKSVSKTGGHLASNLGVVELTLALESIFDFSTDRLIWDVGHQSYVHKILTGRREGFDKLRKFGGISGFPKTCESEFDAFNTGHSSTSASAALGIAHARDLSGDNYDVVAVFGDGAMTGGMIFEALNNAGHSNTKVIYILNDNQMSISKNVGAVSAYLQKLRLKPEYFKSKETIEDLLQKLPVGSKTATNFAKRTKDALKKQVVPLTMFDNLGLNYLGPVDGHDIDAMKMIFERAKNSDKSSFIHIRTIKGKGYKPAETHPQEYHGISAKKPNKVVAPDYSLVFGNKLCQIAAQNKKVIAITGAMPLGTGLAEYATKFKDRYFDVGIAEQHAVCMAAGLAIKGYIPVVPLYSTFMQRAYDQILHDVCLQNLHVVLCADRAGVVGQDGETHQGMYDISYLSHMPNMSILSPSNFTEFEEMLDYAINEHNGPITIRYPRGNTQAANYFPFRFGNINKIQGSSDILIISSGRICATAEEVSEKLDASLLYLPTIRPFNNTEIPKLAEGKKLIVTIEDGTKTGGLGSMVATALQEAGVASKLLICAFPDEGIIHGSIAELDRYYKMDTDSILKKIEEKLNG